MNRFSKIIMLAAAVFAVSSCAQKKLNKHTLVVLDPGHFHAALLQKSAIPEINDTVYVYAPEGEEVEQYLESIEAYNSREDKPTSWVEIVYKGEDYLEKMLSDKKGDIVVLAGNNQKKTDYILASVQNGMNVLSDKPLAINSKDYAKLQEAYEVAKSNKVLIYELMTERYDVLNLVEKSILSDKVLFGDLQKGSEEDPAVTLESIHHFCKYVSGKPLRRPLWYYDVEQQGEGIADVTTHLIDILSWECFPNQEIHPEDVEVCDANHWCTKISLDDYNKSTGATSFPAYLNKYIDDGILNVPCNGEILYKEGGVNVKIRVIWNFMLPEGGGDMFNSVKKGSGAYLITKQDSSTSYKRELYIAMVPNSELNPSDLDYFNIALQNRIKDIQKTMPYVSLEKAEIEGYENAWHVVIPSEDRTIHEEHFNMVANTFLKYLDGEKMPEWEVPNTLSKYYITTTAVQIAESK